MKPINTNESGCDPISSNCVIWQGPDIDCIHLCKGDTVSTVVYKLATELCTLMETFNITNYDLSCFNLLECAPKDFKSLIQLLIERVCACCGVEPIPTPTGTGCPDCVVTVCSSFYETTPQGDLITTMQLDDYVRAIGSAVCTIISQISTIQTTLSDHEDRITVLEDAIPPVFNIPEIVPTCVITPAVLTPIDVVLAALETQFCNLRTYTGDTTAIMTAIQAACVGLNTSTTLSGNGTDTMSSIPGWVSTPTNLSESFSNLWKTVCDIRSAITYIQSNCCDTGCNAIDLHVDGELLNPASLRLTFSGVVPSNYADQLMGSTIQILDAVGGSQTINGVAILAAYYNPSQAMTVALTSVNGSSNITIKTTYRFVDPVTSASCENLVQTLVLGVGTCPTLDLVPSYDGIDCSFTWLGMTPQIMIVELWNNAETIMLQSQTINVIGTTPSCTFLGLAEGTAYKIRLRISGVACGFATTTTLAYPCIAPTLHAPTITYTDPQGTTTGSTIAGWYAQYEFYHPMG